MHRFRTYAALALLCFAALPSITRGQAPVSLQPFSWNDGSTTRVAAATPRATAVSHPQVVRGEMVGGYDNDAAETTGGAMRVAYYVPHPTMPSEPRSYEADDDQDFEQQPSHDEALDVGGSHPTVPGNRAIIRNGIAYAPSNAPQRVKQAIWAVNSIVGRPYVWGGGHSSFSSYGYDCSGTVSFALHYAGLLERPLASNELTRYGDWGRGRWFTIYSRNGHTFAVIAGLRLDTTDFRRSGNEGPHWHNDGRDTWGFVARHPDGL